MIFTSAIVLLIDNAKIDTGIEDEFIFDTNDQLNLTYQVNIEDYNLFDGTYYAVSQEDPEEFYDAVIGNYLSITMIRNETVMFDVNLSLSLYSGIVINRTCQFNQTDYCIYNSTESVCEGPLFIKERPIQEGNSILIYEDKNTKINGMVTMGLSSYEGYRINEAFVCYFARSDDGEKFYIEREKNLLLRCSRFSFLNSFLPQIYSNTLKNISCGSIKLIDSSLAFNNFDQTLAFRLGFQSLKFKIFIPIIGVNVCIIAYLHLKKVRRKRLRDDNYVSYKQSELTGKRLKNAREHINRKK